MKDRSGLRVKKMKTLITILTIIICNISYSQAPDYSVLSKKEKLQFMNYYGFIILKTKDTIIGKVKCNTSYNALYAKTADTLSISYPKELEPFTYKKRIALSNIDKFYFGQPPKFNIVKKYGDKYVNLEIVEEKRYRIYIQKLLIIEDNRMLMYNWNTSLPNSSSSYTLDEILYISKNDGNLICIQGTKHEKRRQLFKLLKDELSDRKVSKLNTSNYRIIELFKKLNTK